jgi:endonuclease G
MKDDEVFVVTGPIYPSNADLKQIGNGVLVPPLIFKAIYIPSENAAAAYIAPNTSEKKFDRVSLADLKARADIDVFPQLPQDVKTTAFALPSPDAPNFHCRVHE